MPRKWVETRFGRALGRGLEYGIHESSRYVGLEHVDEINERLAEGDSALVIGNHPNSETAAMVVGETCRRFSAASEKGILASSKFWGVGGDMGWTGDMSLMMMKEKWGMEPLMVAQDTNAHISEDERKGINIKMIRRTLEILKRSGGVMWMYQEGTRCPVALGRAQEGISMFVSEADWVLQAVADYGKWRPGKKVEFLSPFPAAAAVTLVADEFDVRRRDASSMVVDYLSVRLARRLPEKRQGAYEEAVAVVEGRDPSCLPAGRRLTLGMTRWAHVPAMFWLLGE